MAKGAYKSNNVQTAFKLPSQLLISIGKPFYFILSHVLLLLIFIFYIIGHQIIRFTKIFQKIKYLVFKIKIPKIKINFPTQKFIIFKKPITERVFKSIRSTLFSKLQFKLPIVRLSFKKRYSIALLIFLSSISLFYIYILRGLPSPKELTTRNPDVSTKIYDRNGLLLYTIYKDKNRTPVKLDDIPLNVRLATIAAEDAEFYSHPGFSLRGMLRALSKNLREGRLEGGSTITQQLVKNALLSSEKTYIRKIRELILSVGVEINFSKDEILEMYLNEVSYGGTVYGIEEASKHYFDKQSKDLTLSEAALLAGLPQSPTRYSPFGNNPDLTFSRQREILHLMRVNKFITPEEEEKAISQRITFAPDKQQILAPHFVMYVREKLIDEYGEEVVQKGGLSVKTTLDYNIQILAEKIIQTEVNNLKNLNVGNAAAIVLDPKNGEVLAMVGSKDYFDIEKGGNVNVTTRLRQPGSSIKVINYAYALSNGFTLASTIEDSPITFSVPGQPPYTPKNYDGEFRGKITIRQALAESRNIPAVKILASYGVNKMIDLGQKMGITTWNDPSRFGLSLTLGGGETKLLDLAQVYSVIANLGVKKEVKSITEVRNYKGKILEQDRLLAPDKNREQKVLDARVAYLLIQVLKDNVARSRAFGLNSMLYLPDHPEIAVKTGTSNDLKDNLTIGFNKNYVVAVWVGNNDGSPMARIASGITGAAPIWNKIMRGLLINQPIDDYSPPEGLVYKECYGRYEWFLEEKQLNCPKIIEPSAQISIE